MRPEPLRQLASQRIVSIMKTQLANRWVAIWLEYGYTQPLNNNYRRMEQQIRQVLKFLQDPSTIPQCFEEIQETQKCLHKMANDLKKIGEDTTLTRVEPGLAYWYARTYVFERHFRDYERDARK